MAKKKDSRPRHDIPVSGWSRDKKFFNGKPLSHWQWEADKLVIDCLVRASMVDTRSLVGEMASKRILELAKAENPHLYQTVLDERDRCRVGLAAVMGAMFENPSTARALDAVNMRKPEAPSRGRRAGTRTPAL
jgi:hypothetical protein